MEDLNQDLWPFLLGGMGEQSGGHGAEDSSGLGYGYAAGCEFEDGHGYGSDLGDPCTAGNEECWGFGFGIAPGEGEAEEEENGSGDGFSQGTGIKRINGMPVQSLDGILVVITNVDGAMAEGFHLRKDMSLHPRHIAYGSGQFALGATPGEASAALDELLEDLQIPFP